MSVVHRDAELKLLAADRDDMLELLGAKLGFNVKMVHVPIHFGPPTQILGVISPAPCSTMRSLQFIYAVIMPAERMSDPLKPS